MNLREAIPVSDDRPIQIPMEAVRPMEYLGWAVALTRWHDETGMFHLLGNRQGELRARKACKPDEIQAFGQVESPPGGSVRGRKCGLCERRYALHAGKVRERLRSPQ